jgi:gp32 DNA binding protein like
MSSFANLKRSSSSSLEKLSKAVESLNAPGNYNDGEEKYWKPELDKSGNGYSIIRFLPAPPQDGDDGLPFVKYYDHGFQGKGGWYIEKSRTTFGESDPLSDYNSELWSSGIEANKDLARKQKRRLHYVSNIYVVKDAKNPENEGTIRLFRYGKKIMEKITQAMNPQFEDEKPIDPFDFWSGANFKLKIRKVDGYQNYDLSEFDSAAPLFDDDDKMEQIWKGEHSLLEVVDPKNFKSYDELKTKLDRVLGLTSPNVSRSNTMEAVKKQKIEEKEDEIDSLMNAKSSDSDDDSFESEDFFKDLFDEE